MENTTLPPEDITQPGAPSRFRIASIKFAPEMELQVEPLKNEKEEVLSIGICPTRTCTIVTENGQIWDMVINEFYCTDEEHGKKVLTQLWEQENWYKMFKQRDV